jgi:anti-sigma factor RsiW
MTTDRSFNDDDLHALADGRLPPEQQDAVEAAVAGNADAAARVGFYRRLNAELHAGYDFMLSEPVPEHLAVRPRRLRWQALTRVAAAVVLLAAGAAGGWLSHDWTDEYDPQAQTLAEEAADAHLIYASQVSRPVEVPATETEQLLAWLAKNLDRQVRVPDLSTIGYKFLGGRLLPSGHNVAGQYMFQNVDGNRVTLYFTPAVEQRDSPFRFIPVEGVSVYYWHDGNFAYALASEVSREQLRVICNKVYSDLNPNAGPLEQW